MKIGYLLVNEELWSPLIRRQVVDLLEEISKENPELKISLVVVHPWYWHLKYGFKLREALYSLRNSSLEVRLVPLLFPTPIPYFLYKFSSINGFTLKTTLSKFTLGCMEVFLFPVLWKLYRYNGFEVFHGRSYPATSILLYFKKYCKKVKLIFDPRSDFPEENRMIGAASINEREFRFWKTREALLLQAADATVCITEYYRWHYQQNYGGMKGCIIPNNVDTRLFHFDKFSRNRIRENEGIEKKTVFCYLGTMYPNSWHRPRIYANLIKSLRRTSLNSIVLFLVPQNCKDYIEKELADEGIHASEYIIRHPEYEEVPAYLSASDFGLFFMPSQKIALSVKVVEYQATGLPVLVNENAISAAIYLKNNNTGLIVNLATGDLDTKATDLSGLDFPEVMKEFSRERIAALAHQNFSNQHVARQYALLYKKLGKSIETTEGHPSV